MNKYIKNKTANCVFNGNFFWFLVVDWYAVLVTKR